MQTITFLGAPEMLGSPLGGRVQDTGWVYGDALIDGPKILYPQQLVLSIWYLQICPQSWYTTAMCSATGDTLIRQGGKISVLSEIRISPPPPPTPTPSLSTPNLGN